MVWDTRKEFSKLFECQGRIEKGKIVCVLSNCSSLCLMLNMNEARPAYRLEYVDKNGILKVVPQVVVESMYFPHLVAIGGRDSCIDDGTRHAFDIPIPRDCQKIEEVMVMIEYVPFSILDKVRSLTDLRMAFMKNCIEVPVAIML